MRTNEINDYSKNNLSDHFFAESKCNLKSSNKNGTIFLKNGLQCEI